MASLAISGIGFALQHFTLLFKNASLVIYSGTQPTTPEIAVVGGNVALATFTFASSPFASYTNASGYDVQTASFVSNTVTPTNSGTASFARCSFTLAAAHAGAWFSGQAYTRGDIVTSNNAYWVCTTGGTAGVTAPTGTQVYGLSDGGVSWSWVAATSSGQVLGDFTVGVTSSFDVVVNSTAFSTSINQTITSFQISSPAY